MGLELLWANTIEKTVPITRKGGKARDSAGSGEYAGFYRIVVFCNDLDGFEVGKWLGKAVIARHAALVLQNATPVALYHSEREYAGFCRIVVFCNSLDGFELGK